MPSSDVAWVDVLPSLSQFVPTLRRELGSSLPPAGRQAGEDFSSNFTRSATSGVDAAAEKLAAARRKEEDAAGKVRVAEAKLQDLRDKGVTSGARLVTAEENLARAQRGLDDSQTLVTRSTQAMETAQGEAERAAGGLDSALDKADKTSGRFSAGIKAAGVALLAAGAVVVGAGKALYDVGATFDDVNDTIRAGTGASGEALDALTESAKNVGKVTPAEFGAIGQTIADVNTRLGLTGPTLETLTQQILEAGRMAGEEIDINGLSAAFNAFNVTGDQTTAAMDQLFQVSQATGIGINELAAGAVKGGPQLQQFGFSIGESAVLLGTLDKAGLDSDKTVAAMSRAMVQFAKDGKDPQEALQGTITEIQRLTASGQDAAAIDLAASVFGTKGAGQFVEAVRAGTIDVQALTAASGQTGDTILGVADETKDFAERWQEFKNRVLVWLEPVASRVFGAMGTAMTEVTGAVQAFGAAWSANDGDVTSSGLAGFMERLAFAARGAFDYVRGTVIPALRDMASWVQSNSTWLLPLVGGIAAAAVAYQAVTTAMGIYKSVTTAVKGAQVALNLAMSANPIGLIVAALVGLGAALYLAYQKSETFRDIVNGVFSAVGGAATWLWENALKPAWDAIKGAWDALMTGISWAWTNILQPVFSVLSTVAQALGITLMVVVFGPVLLAWQLLTGGIKLAWEYVLKPVWDAVSAAATWLWDTVLSPIFTAIGLAWAAIGTGIGVVWNTVIKPVWDALQTAAQFLWDTILSPIFAALTLAWEALGTGLKTVYDTIIAPIFSAFGAVVDVLKQGFDTAVGFIATVWEGLKDKLMGPVQWVIDFVWNDGLRKLWNTINNLWGGDDLEPFRVDGGAGGGGGGAAQTGAGGTGSGGTARRLSDGGVLPGHTPGRDVHRFVSPTAGRLDLSGGEAVMRPEFTRVLGVPKVNFLNQLARTQGEAGLRAALGGGPWAQEGLPPRGQALAAGGVVTLPGWLDTTLSLPGMGGIRDIVSSINSGDGWGGGLWGDALLGTAKSVGSKVVDAVKGFLGLGGPELVGGTIASGGQAPSTGGRFPTKRSGWPARRQGSVSANTAASIAAVKAAFPQIRSVGTIGARPNASDHPTGKAADYMIPGWQTPAGRGLGYQVADFLASRSLQDGLNYLIFNDQITSGQGWRSYTHPNGATTNPTLRHLDHDHASYFDQGGLWQPGVLGMNETDGVERVLTPPQDRTFRDFVDVGGDLIQRAPTEVNGFVNHGTVHVVDLEDLGRTQRRVMRRALAGAQ